MRRMMRCLLFLVMGTSTALLATAQGPQDQPWYELHLVKRPGDPHSSCYVTWLTFGMAKEQPVLFFAKYFGIGGHAGLWRWDLGKTGLTDLASPAPRLSKLPVVDGATVDGIVSSRDGRILLVSYAFFAPPDFGGPVPRKFQNLSPFFEVWDVEANKNVLTLKPTEDRWGPRYGTLSADGKTAVVVEEFRVKPMEQKGGWERRVVFWDVASGKQTRSLAGLSGPLALSPDGDLLAARPSQDFNKMVLVDANAGKARVTLAQPKDGWSPYAFRFAPTGKYVAGRQGGHDPLWVVWDLQGKIVLGDEPKSRPRSLCFLTEPDKKGREWLTYEDRVEPVFRNPFSEKRERLNDKVESIAVSPDGKLFAAGENGVIRVWKMKR